MADDKHLIEQHTGETVELFKGKFLHAVRDTVRLPDGKLAAREYIRHPGAVMAVPLLEDGRVVLVRQYRHPLRRVMLEFPAGKLDAGEDSLVCARRELLEETGYTAAQWAYAGALHLAIAYSDEKIDVWFARGLAAGQARPDEGEFVEVVTATVPEVLDWCRQGLVTDSKTLAAALWLQNIASGSWKLDWRT